MDDIKLTIITPGLNFGQYIERYEESIEQISEYSQFIFVATNPTTEELDKLNRLRFRWKSNFIIYTSTVKSISLSENIGMNGALGKYIAFHDVDDMRVPGSIEAQIRTLDENPNIDLTYGDSIAVRSQGETTGELIETPDIANVGIEFFRRNPGAGNIMFRRSLLEKIGLWDEQIRSAGDYDFQIRCAYNTTFKKTPGPMLYYTYWNPNAMSSNPIAQRERLLIKLRYGIFDSLNFRYLHEIAHYRVGEIKNLGEWKSVADCVPNYEELLERASPEIRKSIMKFWTFDTFARILRAAGVINTLEDAENLWRKLKRDVFRNYLK